MSEINVDFPHAVPGYLDAFLCEGFCLALSAAGATINVNQPLSRLQNGIFKK